MFSCVSERNPTKKKSFAQPIHEPSALMVSATRYTQNPKNEIIIAVGFSTRSPHNTTKRLSRSLGPTTHRETDFPTTRTQKIKYSTPMSISHHEVGWDAGKWEGDTTPNELSPARAACPSTRTLTVVLPLQRRPGRYKRAARTAPNGGAAPLQVGSPDAGDALQEQGRAALKQIVPMEVRVRWGAPS